MPPLSSFSRLVTTTRGMMISWRVGEEEEEWLVMRRD
jgi:hypothetical protein